MDKSEAGDSGAATVVGVISRLAPVAVAMAVLAAVLTGCTPEPEETDPTPVFSSEAEAFAAAEETYRAYVDAVNDRRADPRSTDPQSFLIGNALEVDIDTQQQLDQAGLAIVGTTVVVSTIGLEASNDLSDVVLAVCMDSTATRVIDSAGSDVTPTERSTMTGLRVTMELFGSDLMISASASLEGDAC